MRACTVSLNPPLWQLQAQCRQIISCLVLLHSSRLWCAFFSIGDGKEYQSTNFLVLSHNPQSGRILPKRGCRGRLGLATGIWTRTTNQSAIGVNITRSFCRCGCIPVDVPYNDGYDRPG
ncbi:uncharacterized protein BT62DRAFT_710724 [Guyanagaster necrorhizus]|uniref:Uncharacterized protein n=1 Tax=Guyanagaster necrorhizus TaxID=856835 RepID=A0A9P7VXP9_9AGAR|nr:uncharacterized protein BT62DRAFT_710724 [Guyanagaster necrorhizus MCA 3950]KAG7448523.1 hypothetical protein BT62DRAFT_710724 [Guyanagaster necrorhizus MCA 3950]